MADICEICNERQATGYLKMTKGGQEQLKKICDSCARQLMRRNRYGGPLDSFLGGRGRLEDIFGDLANEFPEFESELGYPMPRREAVEISQYFSEITKQVIQKAGEIAVEFGRNQLDTEHLLYALVDNDVVHEILRQFKISPEDLKSYIDMNAPKGQRIEEEKVELTITPRIKSVLENAFLIASDLGHGYIGPEHLLIALAQEGEGLASNTLQKYGLTVSALRQQTLKVVGKGAKEGKVAAQSTTPNLDKVSRDLAQMARQGKLDPVIGRAEEIETVIEVLSRRTKNNPVLIGEPGVGKTAIVEGLAQRIVNGSVPELLYGKRMVELNINAIVAGTKYRGEFEERIKQVLDEILAHQDELILFIDELQVIMGAGGAGHEGGLDVSQIIKPYLAKGELHLIGATTLSEYQKYIEKDAALERRFQPVFIGEPTVPQTIEILRGLRDKYEAHHKVAITDDSIVVATELSDRYITNRFLPDKAIDLIDQAASRVRIRSTARSSKVKELEDRLNSLRREQEAAVNQRKFDEAKNLEEQIVVTESEKQEEENKMVSERGVAMHEVRREHIAEVVSKLTGIPVTELTQEERERLLAMEAKIHERIVGQNEAVSAVSDAIRLSRAGLARANRPIATFMFLGPTGVGKTELAKSIAWVLFGDENALVRLDMSEYMERFAASRLTGAPPGYVGYEEGGQLTESVRRRPYSVILLDEIEKAHPDVFNVLLQVFDDGRLTDGKGRVVDFTNTVIISTSNIGSDVIQRELQAKEQDRISYEVLRDRLRGVLKLSFRPEFLNRIDEIIVFHALDRQEIRAIVVMQLEELKRLMRGQGVGISFDNSVIDYIAEIGYVPEFGAREIRRQIKSEIETRLARAMLGGEVNSGQDITVSYDKEKRHVVIGKPMAEAA
jgi:ATP-dependent Clp protease ATP-binding subunit ClpC